MLRKSDEDLLMNFLQSQNLNNSNSQFLLDRLETFAKNRGIRASKGTLAGFINRARIQSKQLLPLSEKKRSHNSYVHLCKALTLKMCKPRNSLYHTFFQLELPFVTLRQRAANPACLCNWH